MAWISKYFWRYIYEFRWSDNHKETRKWCLEDYLGINKKSTKLY